jgi:hypothetical protein
MTDTVCTYDVRVRQCTAEQLASYARTATLRGAIVVERIDASPNARRGAYRITVCPDRDGPDAATTMAALTWSLRATGRLISAEPRF